MSRVIRNPSLRKKAVAFGFVYFSTAVVFAFVYWLAWQANPDSFIVHQELNLFPISELQSIARGSGAETPATRLIPSLNEAYQLVEQYKQNLTALQKEVGRLDQLLKQQNETYQRVYKDFEQSRQESIEKYRNEALQPIRTQLGPVEERIKALTGIINASTDKPTRSLFELQLANAEVEKAQLKISHAQKELEVANEIVSKFGIFGDSSKRDEFKGVMEARDNLQQSLNTAKTQYHQILIDAEKAWVEIRNKRVRRLNLGDFVYFSLGVSTTTTMGDIVPNILTIRLIVIAQLIISTIIVGLFLTILGEVMVSKTP